jgi:hypothetical protein
LQTSSRRYGLLTNPACTSQNHGFISSSIPNMPESMKHEPSCSLPGVGNGTIMTRRMGQALGNFLCSESSHPAERHEWHRTDLWCYKPCPNGSHQYFLQEKLGLSAPRLCGASCNYVLAWRNRFPTPLVDNHFRIPDDVARDFQLK